MIITEVKIPEFGVPCQIPFIPATVYAARVAQVRQRMLATGLDCLLVYADREHSANIAYCTGFDPRFEEALLVLTAEGRSALCVGNECVNVVSALPIPADILLCQEFSLMGQDRSVSWDLKPVLRKAGLSAGMRCGIAGWKSLKADRLETPHYIVELVTELSGSRPRNANDLFMHPRDGLRIHNEPDQIAFFEYAATRTSASVLNLLRALKPGISCVDVARQFDDGGLPQSCHPMLACGETIPNGMASPGNDKVQAGQYLTCAFGIWGALTSRAGVLTADPADLTSGSKQAAFKLIDNYLGTVRAWYAALDIGVTAGEVWAATDGARDKSLFTFCVNPGHYLHLDEWLSSPFWQGSDIALGSGSVLQADIIPVSCKDPISVNMEDGLLLADARLRAELEATHPALYRRCQARRRFMMEVLGYRLTEAVLPLGNIPGVYFPCLLDTGLVCCA